MFLKILYAIVPLIAIATPAGAATITLSDQVFDDADWTIATLELGGGGIVNASQALTGGNLGEYRNVVNEVVNGPGTIRGFHLNTTAVYDPSTQGAIASLDYYEDSIMFDGFGQGQASAAALFQDGIYYYSTRRVLANQLNSWTSQSILSLTALEFTDGNLATPDFSSSGGLITFGFARSNSIPGAGGYIIDAGIDNWAVSINTVNPVPVPAALWLFGTALFGLAGLRRCNKTRG